MRRWSTGAPPVSDVTHIAKVRTRRVEVVRDVNAVQVVNRPSGVDDGARACVIQDRDRQRVGEGHPDGGRGLARGVLLVNFLYGY